VEFVGNRQDCSVVVDFSRVDVAGGATLTELLQLWRSLQDHGRGPVLCSVAPAMRGGFTIARLDAPFDFVRDKFAAVAAAVRGLRHAKNVRVVFDACVEVNRLENVGDMMRDRVLTELFVATTDRRAEVEGYLPERRDGTGRLRRRCSCR
jgi:hypothetical protein